ncbi:MAG: ECF transporter S component [Tissierellia bacterium]|nr:ECF transporter S component [Tissierellia bacterium]
MNQVNQVRKNRIETATMVKVSVLSVIAYMLMYIDFPLGFIAPPFIKMDISDMPALIGGFAMGPVVGVGIELFKNILHILLKGTSTGGVGELSNFLIGSIFVFTAATIYKKHRTYKGAFFGLLAGIIAMTVLATVSNYFVVFPLYAKLMVPMETIIEMGSAVSPRITDLWTMMIYSIAPFNILKGLLVSAVTMLLYKRVSHILHK